MGMKGGKVGYGYQWWTGTVDWHGTTLRWSARGHWQWRATHRRRAGAGPDGRRHGRRLRLCSNTEVAEPGPPSTPTPGIPFND